MRFENVEYLLLFFVIPCFHLLLRVSLQLAEKRRARFADSEVQKEIIKNPKKKEKTLIVSFIIFLLVVSMLRPQWGFSWKKISRKGIDIVVALDVSESMLATDVHPSRLERAKRKITDLLNSLRGDRIALVSFAGISYVECPLTLDYETYKLFLNSLNTNSVPIKGTNLENALEKSLEVLGVSTLNVRQDYNDRAIILITDGEELDGDFRKISEIAAKANVHIYILGIGTNEGAPIPTENGYKKDKDGRVVISRLNESILQELAVKTGGLYVQSISSEMDTDTIYTRGIKSMLKESEFAQDENKQWNEYYQLPLLIALVLLVFFYWRPKFKFFNLLLFFLPFLQLRGEIAFAQSVESMGKEATSLYENSKFDAAKENFSKAREKAPEDIRPIIGEASSMYRLGNFEQAQGLFYEVVSKAKTNKEKASALYNAGNSLVKQEKYQEAIKTYEESLKLNPDDQEAKDNLEYAKKKLEEQKKQEEKDKQDKQEQNNQDKQQNEDRQNQDQQQQEKGNNDQQENQDHSPANQEQSNQEQDEKPEQQQDTRSPTPTNTPGDKEQQNSTSNQGAQEQKDDHAASPSQEENLSNEQKADFDQLLESIDEKSKNRLNYRYQKSINEMKRNKQKLPEKDW